MNPRRRGLLAVLAFGLPGTPARAGPGPLRLLVPGDAGGVLDIRARWLAPRLGASLSRPVRVENLPGAAGLIGMRAARSGPKDGSMLVMVHQGTLAINPHLYPDPGYDALRDFLPLTRMGHGPLVIAVPAASGVTTVTELVAAGRRGSLSFSSPGAGTPPHLAACLFARAAGLKVLHVPFKGGGHALTAVLGGQVDFIVDGATAIRPQAAAGRLRALAHTGRAPLPGWPDLPSAANQVESLEYEAWTGLALPAGTPAAILDPLHVATMQSLNGDDAANWFAERGAAVGAGPAEAFGAFVREEHAVWGRRIHELGIEVDRPA